jgi:hypothetical protein
MVTVSLYILCSNDEGCCNGWLDGCVVKQPAPQLLQAVSKRTMKTRLVCDALTGEQWIRDINGSLSVSALIEYVNLWAHLQTVQLDMLMPDQLIWKWTSNQQYSAASTYLGFFHTSSAASLAPGSCARLGCCQAASYSSGLFSSAAVGLQQHNLHNNGPCAMCMQADETIQHLVLGCVVAREVWFDLPRRRGLQHLTPTVDVSIADWRCASRKRIPKPARKSFDSFTHLIVWSVWKERNNRVFNNTSTPPRCLMQLILNEDRACVAAGFTALSPFVA